MKLRERMGTSIRTMVKVTTEAWERGGRQGETDRLVTSTRMGSSLRRMVKVKVTTDGDKRQDDGECDYGNMGEREKDVEASEHEGL